MLIPGDFNTNFKNKMMNIKIVDSTKSNMQTISVSKKLMPSKQYVAKLSEFSSKELNSYKMAQELELENIIHIVALQNSSSCLGVQCTSGYTVCIFEKCPNLDLGSCKLTSLNRPIIAQHLKSWTVFDDLKRLNIIFMDWKPGNILVYGNVESGQVYFKLTDLESVQIPNVEVESSKCFFNEYFSSPMISHCFPSIFPEYSDDVIGLGYVICWTISDKLLPWCLLSPFPGSSTFVINTTIFNCKTDKTLHFIDYNTIFGNPKFCKFACAFENIYKKFYILNFGLAKK